MAALTPYRRAALEGVRAAQREHQRLRTDFTSRVEIFDVIENEQIWLVFQRLGNLYGAYQRCGDAIGIVVSSQHPLSLQRYTAAHEYGHHVLGHTVSADDETRIHRRSQYPREIAAQAFAGEFLMPLQLVTSARARPETACLATSVTTASPSLPGLSTGSDRAWAPYTRPACRAESA